MNPEPTEPTPTSGLGARTLAARAMEGAKAPASSKYGNMNPKKKLIQKDVKYFDSADWALEKGGAAPTPPVGTGGEQLPPKLEPNPLEQQVRRVSTLSQPSTDGGRSLMEEEV